jgi:ubiquinone/menaquinone biosynthesis C-methylase UbiE
MSFVAMQGSDGKVLEVGSLNVNGMMRNYYKDYIGVDMRSGENVDVIANGHQLPFSDETFDKVLSLETLEHDSEFWTTIKELVRVLKVGGKLIITARGIGFPKHDFPNDFYRFTGPSIIHLFQINNIDKFEVREDISEAGILAHGIKK